MTTDQTQGATETARAVEPLERVYLISKFMADHASDDEEYYHWSEFAGDARDLMVVMKEAGYEISRLARAADPAETTAEPEHLARIILPFTSSYRMAIQCADAVIAALGSGRGAGKRRFEPGDKVHIQRTGLYGVVTVRWNDGTVSVHHGSTIERYDPDELELLAAAPSRPPDPAGAGGEEG